MKSEIQAGNRRHATLSRYVPLVVWIAVIFALSSSQGSFSETSRVIRPILEFLFPSAPPETITLYHGMIRKFAHFAEYAVLGILACRAFADSSASYLRKYFWAFAIALILLTASADEFNQSFNPERTSSAIDVMIDVSGGLAAILVWLWLRRKVDVV